VGPERFQFAARLSPTFLSGSVVAGAFLRSSPGWQRGWESLAWVATVSTEIPKALEAHFLRNALKRQAGATGLDYFRVVQESEKRNAPELANLFRVTPHVDGAPAELHVENLYSSLNSFGDRLFSTALTKESKTVRDEVIQSLDFF
jgi:hypothetical protein